MRQGDAGDDIAVGILVVEALEQVTDDLAGRHVLGHAGVDGDDGVKDAVGEGLVFGQRLARFGMGCLRERAAGQNGQHRRRRRGAEGCLEGHMFSPCHFVRNKPFWSGRCCKESSRQMPDLREDGPILWAEISICKGRRCVN